VKDENITSDEIIGWYAIRSSCVKPGYRIIPLRSKGF